MRLLIIVLVIIFILIFFYSIKIGDDVRNLKYNVDFEDINLNDFSIQDFSTIGSKVKLKLKIFILNKGNLPISFRDLNIQAYYKNKLIAESSKNESSNYDKIRINPFYVNGGFTSFSQYFDVYLNKELVELLGRIKSNLNPSIQYKAGISWYGLKLSTDSSYTIKK